jgi:hypothetical protein
VLHRVLPLVLLIGIGPALAVRPAVADWPPNGVLVSQHSSTQSSPSIASDGAGGAFILWRDLRDLNVTDLDHYIQHITADGKVAPGWPADGVPLCTAPGPQFFAPGACLIPDGLGGAIATWWDRRNGTDDDIYALRITAAGNPSPGWPVDGVRLTAIPRTEAYATLASDEAGGAFVVWEDSRHFVYPTNQTDIFAMHLLADGTRAPGWPENGLAICTLPGNDATPRVLPDGAGGVLITRRRGWRYERCG